MQNKDITEEPDEMRDETAESEETADEAAEEKIDETAEEIIDESSADSTDDISHNDSNESHGSDRRKMKKSFRRGIITGVACTLAVCIIVCLAGTLIFNHFFGNDVLTSNVQAKIKVIAGIINNYYYEDVDADQMADGLYHGIMSSMDDPYSSYLNKEEYQDLLEDTTQQYAGIGAGLQRDQDTGKVTITYVYPSTPAEEAGLKAGDEIVSADGYSASDFTDLDEFVKHIRGDENTTVTLVYLRNGKKNTVDVERKNITLPTVSYKMLDEDDKIGYILISQFSSNTANEFETALSDLQSQGVKAVIYDLRTNPGGLVDSVVKILDDLLPEGTVVSMKDRNGKETKYTSDAENHVDLPTAVLISGQTASAAEIFSGAVRDFNYGTLIGTKTYGKGIVQQTIPLGDGTAVKLTTQTYYTPSGECIHKLGIEPDIELEYKYTGDDDTAYLASDNYDYSADNQVQKAIEVLKKEIR